MSWKRYLPWFATDTKTESDSEPTSDGERLHLVEVEWEEEVEVTAWFVKRRYVWSNGVERTFTINESDQPGYMDWKDEIYTATNGRVDPVEEPAYIETLDDYEETRTETQVKRAWVSVVPDGFEETGETKTVEELR